MSSNGFAPCRVFEIGPSPRFTAIVVALYALATGALLAAQLQVLVKLGALLVLGVSLSHALRTYAMRTGPGAVIRLVRRDGGVWVAERRDGTAFIGALARDSVIHRHLVVVGIEDGWRTLFTPVPADALNVDDHRRLRVWVKWQPPPKSDGRVADA